MEQSGEFTLTQFLFPFTACAMKPSIFPPSMSVVALVAPWGPPPLTSAASWKGETHVPVVGLFTHTVNLPPAAGSPSPPG
jgi:hypothetical protein